MSGGKGDKVDNRRDRLVSFLRRGYLSWDGDAKGAIHAALWREWREGLIVLKMRGGRVESGQSEGRKAAGGR